MPPDPSSTVTQSKLYEEVCGQSYAVTTQSKNIVNLM